MAGQRDTGMNAAHFTPLIGEVQRCGSLGAEEQHPGREVGGEGVEAMRHALGREEHVADARCQPLAITVQHGAATGDQIEFVARMGCLGVDIAGREQFQDRPFLSGSGFDFFALDRRLPMRTKFLAVHLLRSFFPVPSCLPSSLGFLAEDGGPGDELVLPRP